MKKSLLIFATLLFGSMAFAQTLPPPVARPAQPQTGARQLPPPLAARTVSGVVKDSTDSTLPGAVVKLVSEKDTLSTSTNMDGIFIFKNVKMATFTMTVSSIGYRMQVKKLFNNDTAPRLTLDPFVLKPDSKILNEVVINGTPSIVYKVDTVEYKASDYKVRPNATLDELLKKMEGMEVGSDGSVTHNGEAVTKVRLNGKDYAGGAVAQAVQNLPAEILEKVQVIDDYGDQAARTGIKTGEPTKTLNVTTKPDRSIGNIGRLSGAVGNNERYRANIYAQRLNANQQITIIGDASNTVNLGTNPGTTRAFAPNFSYRDQFGPKVQLNTSARYSSNSRDATSESYGVSRSNGTRLPNGTNIGQSISNFNRNSAQTNNSNNGGANINFEYTIDSLNYLQIQPNFSYTTSEQFSNNYNDTYTKYGNGSIDHRVSTGDNNSRTPSTGFGTTVFFLHKFKKRRPDLPNRNVSITLTANRSQNNSDGENNNQYAFYADSTLNTKLRSDSIVHLFNNRDRTTNNFRFSTTYTEPISAYSQFDFNAQINQNQNSTSNTQDTVLANGTLKRLDRLSNIFDYTTTESRFSFNYRYQGTRVNFALGTTLVPYNLSGTRFNNNSGGDANTSQSFFRILPIARFAYSWSRTQRIQFNYNGNFSEPDFTQIQPFTDRTNIFNVVIGNPNLKPSFNHSISGSYNNYFPNSRFNIALNANANYTLDQIIQNTISYVLPIAGGGQQRYSEQYFTNISGSKNIGGNYSVSKQLADRRYNLSLNGRVNYSYNLAMDNNILYHQTTWQFNERFGPRITPVDDVEINPYFGTDLRRSFSTLGTGNYSQSVTNSLGIDGRFYFLKTYRISYDASKRLITQQSGGIPTSNNSPLVINMGAQKEFGQKRQFTVTLDVFDVLKQNNFIEQNVTANSTTNSITSAMSRYFLLGFRLNLQKWSGRPQRAGRDMQRRGDGSFIYN